MLFTVAQLGALAGREVDPGTHQGVHDYVSALIVAEIGDRITDPPPPGVTAVAIELARAALPAPGGVASSTVGPFSVAYAPPREAGVTGRQAARLRRAAGLGNSFTIHTEDS